jgi:hypothetical protein
MTAEGNAGVRVAPERRARTPAGRAAAATAAPFATARAAHLDALFLTVVVVLSAALYIPGLGFYSDDWALIALMHQAADGSLAGLYESLRPTGIGTRPVQALWLAVLYSLFGVQPLGYHVANAVMLAVMAVLFHLCLRQLGLPRAVALATALVFATLPHYSTGRIWIAAFQAPLAVLLYLGSLYGDLRFVRGPAWTRWLWKGGATAALVASVLAYEITAGLLVLTPLVVWQASRSWRNSADGAPKIRHAFSVVVVTAVNLAALVMTVMYKATTTQRTAFLDGLLWRIRYAAEGATSVAFGSYGIALPVRLANAFRNHFDPAVLLVSVAVAVLAWSYLTRVMGSAGPIALRVRDWAVLVAAGLVTFGAGYAVALFTFEIGFATTGMNNRTAQAAALGAALTFTALVGLLSALLRSPPWQSRCFRLGVALLAGAGTVLVNTIAGHWVEAAREQRAVIASIDAEFSVLPEGTVLLLDGICPYTGPGVVFETQWDVAGMLRLHYDDASLLGNVVRPNIEVTPEGIRTLLYDDVVHFYPYTSEPLVFDVRNGTAVRLTTEADARHYFSAVSDRGTACPAGEEGYGVPIF